MAQNASENQIDIDESDNSNEDENKQQLIAPHQTFQSVDSDYNLRSKKNGINNNKKIVKKQLSADTTNKNLIRKQHELSKRLSQQEFHQKKDRHQQFTYANHHNDPLVKNVMQPKIKQLNFANLNQKSKKSYYFQQNQQNRKSFNKRNEGQETNTTRCTKSHSRPQSLQFRVQKQVSQKQNENSVDKNFNDKSEMQNSFKKQFDDIDKNESTLLSIQNIEKSLNMQTQRINSLVRSIKKQTQQKGIKNNNNTKNYLLRNEKREEAKNNNLSNEENQERARQKRILFGQIFSKIEDEENQQKKLKIKQSLTKAIKRKNNVQLTEKELMRRIESFRKGDKSLKGRTQKELKEPSVSALTPTRKAQASTRNKCDMKEITSILKKTTGRSVSSKKSALSSGKKERKIKKQNAIDKKIKKQDTSSLKNKQKQKKHQHQQYKYDKKDAILNDSASARSQSSQRKSFDSKRKRQRSSISRSKSKERKSPKVRVRRSPVSPHSHTPSKSAEQRRISWSHCEPNAHNLYNNTNTLNNSRSKRESFDQKHQLMLDLNIENLKQGLQSLQMQQNQQFIALQQQVHSSSNRKSVMGEQPNNMRTMPIPLINQERFDNSQIGILRDIEIASLKQKMNQLQKDHSNSEEQMREREEEQQRHIQQLNKKIIDLEKQIFENDHYKRQVQSLQQQVQLKEQEIRQIKQLHANIQQKASDAKNISQQNWQQLYTQLADEMFILRRELQTMSVIGGQGGQTEPVTILEHAKTESQSMNLLSTMRCNENNAHTLKDTLRNCYKIGLVQKQDNQISLANAKKQNLRA